MATKQYPDKVALVYDQGLYVHVAEKLAEDFGQVLYYCDWRGAFPFSQKAHVGIGLDGITVVRNPWEHFDDVDLYVFPDVYFGPEQAFLRKLGKRVWGSGGVEALELYRGDLKKILTDLGLPVPRYEEITGMAALREYLRTNEDVFVKASLFRGDCETFHSPNYDLIRGKLDEMVYELGPRQDTIEFIVEHKVKGAEYGYDGSSVLGKFSNIAAWGYENKDKGYLGKIVAYRDLPPVLRKVNAALAPLMAELDMRSFWSTEVRGKYLIDPAARAGSPPSEVYIEGFRNWATHIWEGADGNLVDLEPDGLFMAEIVIESGRAEKHFLPLEFPEEMRRWIKIHGHCIQDGIDYAVPLGITQCAAAVGVGRTLEEAMKIAKEAAESIEGGDVSYDENALNKTIDKIQEGVEEGIEW